MVLKPFIIFFLKRKSFVGGGRNISAIYRRRWSSDKRASSQPTCSWRRSPPFKKWEKKNLMVHESLIDWVSLAHSLTRTHVQIVHTHTHLSTPPPTSPRSLAGLFASGLRDFLSNFRWMISPQQRSFLSFFSFSPSLSFLLRSCPSSALLTRVWTAACEVPQVSRCCCCCCPFRGSVERRIFSRLIPPTSRFFSVQIGSNRFHRKSWPLWLEQRRRRKKYASKILIPFRFDEFRSFASKVNRFSRTWNRNRHLVRWPRHWRIFWSEPT